MYRRQSYGAERYSAILFQDRRVRHDFRLLSARPSPMWSVMYAGVMLQLAARLSTG